jgi:ureidoacrylate peracid hydrolase
LHRTEIFAGVAARVKARSGKEHPFDVLDPRRTALVVIDMQNYFVHPESPAALPVARAIVPSINLLAAELRHRGGLVAWVRTGARDTLDAWSVYNNHLMTPERRDRRLAAMGADGFHFWRENDIHDEDLLVTKTRFSAFIQGSSDIDSLLRQRGIDSLLIVGTVAGICCESSARDAMMLNYKVVMVSDALASYSDMEHNAALSGFYAMFGDVQTVQECVASLDRGTSAKPPHALAAS